MHAFFSHLFRPALRSLLIIVEFVDNPWYTRSTGGKRFQLVDQDVFKPFKQLQTHMFYVIIIEMANRPVWFQQIIICFWPQYIGSHSIYIYLFIEQNGVNGSANNWHGTVIFWSHHDILCYHSICSSCFHARVHTRANGMGFVCCCRCFWCWCCYYCCPGCHFKTTNSLQ